MCVCVCVKICSRICTRVSMHAQIYFPTRSNRREKVTQGQFLSEFLMV